MDKKIAFIAAAAHTVNAAYCRSIGDTSQPEWADAPENIKASAIAGVKMHLANPDATPEQSHEAWMAHKLAEGWKFGPEKDAKKKEHPCLVAYGELPPEQRTKDYLFKATVHALKDLPADPLAPPAPPAAPAAGTPAVKINGLMPITYVGKRETYKDGLYGTQLTFAKGQTRMVPTEKATLMLKHPDTYALGKTTDAIAQQPPEDKPRGGNTPEQDEEDRLEDTRRSIGTMNRRALANFAKVNFNREMDPDKQDAPAMRAQILTWLDQFGMPA